MSEPRGGGECPPCSEDLVLNFVFFFFFSKYTKRRSVIRKLLGRVILAVGVVGVMTLVRGVGGWDAAAEYVREFVGEGRLYLGV